MTLTRTPADSRKQLSIGILGCGFMGKCHSNAFRKIPYIYSTSFVPRLLVLCGRNAEKLAREAARYGFEERTTDWLDVVRDERVDVFDNCGPDPLHAEPSIEALRRGKHVICEKPLAVSAEAARQMRDAARAARGKALCVFNYRFVPAVRLAKDLIASGRIGRIYQVRVSYLQMAGHDPATPPDRVWYARWPHSGVLQGIGSHAIDQCRYLAGEVKSVSAAVRTFHPERAIPAASAGGACAGGTSPTGGASTGGVTATGPVADEASAAVLELEGGAIAVVESSGVATGRKNFLSWEIHGSKGSLRWDLEHPNSLFACGAGPAERTSGRGSGSQDSLDGFAEVSVTDPSHPYVADWWPPGHNLGWEHCHIIEKMHFLDAVASGKPMSPHLATFEDGYRVAVIIDAVRESSRTGRKVEVAY